MRNVTLFAFILSLPLVVCGSFTAATQDKGAKGADKKLQGTWVGKRDPVNFTFTIKGDKFTFQMEFGDKKVVAKGIVKTNATKSPKTLDMVFKEAKGEMSEFFKGTARGIYKFEKDNFVWCMNKPGESDRPEAFENKPGYLLLTYERKK